MYTVLQQPHIWEKEPRLEAGDPDWSSHAAVRQLLTCLQVIDFWALVFFPWMIVSVRWDEVYKIPGCVSIGHSLESVLHLFATDTEYGCPSAPSPPCYLFSAPPLLAEGPSKGRVRDLRTLAGRDPFTYPLGETEAATHGAGGLTDQERGRSQLRPQGREKGLTSSERGSSRWPGMDGTKRRRCLQLASFQRTLLCAGIVWAMENWKPCLPSTGGSEAYVETLLWNLRNLTYSLFFHSVALRPSESLLTFWWVLSMLFCKLEKWG